MMEEWRAFTTAELIASGVLEIGDGYRAKNSEMGAGGLPFIRAGDVNGRVNTIGTDILASESVSKAGPKISEAGDVVITTKGTVGRLAYVKEDDPKFVYSPQLCYWRSRDHNIIIPAWLFYALQSDEFKHQILWSAGQTDMAPYVSLTDQRTSFKLTVPPLPEQRAIAAVLGALDDKIELNRRMNETLERQARAIFRDWFVDFGPTRAKQEKREPYLAPELWSLFPDRLDDEGKPEGWTAGTLDQLSHLNSESWSVKSCPATVAYVDLSNTKWGYIETVEQYTWDNAPSRARRVLRPGDTIIGTVRPGNGSYAFINQDGLTGSTGFAVLRAKSSTDQALVWCAATSKENIERLTHLADGGAYPAVRPDVVSATEINIADKSIRDAFAQIVDPRLKRMEAGKAESRTLAETRDLLLPKLMSGEIRIRDAEKIVEDAA